MEGSEQQQEGIVYVRLKAYLDELEQRENSRPEGQRRRVPRLEELARVAEITPEGLSKIVNNRTTMLNRHTLAAILDELNRRGFPSDVGNILSYRPPESEGGTRTK